MAYIEKEPIVEFITKGLNNPDKTKAYGYDAIEILTEIEYAPTADVVEVPCRCKDCRYSQVTDNGRFHNKIYCFQPAPIKQIVETEEERFCSYGKRRDT